MTRASDDGWLRRHAIQIAAQLPEEQSDALAVLGLAKQIVEEFMGPRGPAHDARQRERLRSETGELTPRRLPISIVKPSLLPK